VNGVAEGERYPHGNPIPSLFIQRRMLAVIQPNPRLAVCPERIRRNGLTFSDWFAKWHPRTKNFVSDQIYCGCCIAFGGCFNYAGIVALLKPKDRSRCPLKFPVCSDLPSDHCPRTAAAHAGRCSRRFRQRPRTSPRIS
jgi:hypothetical protein